MAILFHGAQVIAGNRLPVQPPMALQFAITIEFQSGVGISEDHDNFLAIASLREVDDLCGSFILGLPPL